MRALAYDLAHLQESLPGYGSWQNYYHKCYTEIEKYIREKLRANNYTEVKTPQVVDRVLWEKSGHWDKFGDMMFTTHSENRDYAVKPMNCPCHVQI